MSKMLGVDLPEFKQFRFPLVAPLSADSHVEFEGASKARNFSPGDPY
jgi:hypothetical protein